MGRDFLASLTPFNTHLGFIAVTCDNQVSMHTFRNGTPEVIKRIQVPKDKLSVVLLAPGDRYAVLIGQSKPLSIYVVDMDERSMGNIEQVILEASKEYAFNTMHDAASVLGDETLLISYRKGHSVTFDLSPALKMMRLE
jgi:hypothetical protein